MRFTFDNNCFNDRWQGVSPSAATTNSWTGLLAGVEVRCGTDFFPHRTHWESLCDRIVSRAASTNTTILDSEAGVPLAALRTRNARHPQLSGRRRNGFHRAQEIPYTRIIEHKHFEPGGDQPSHDHYPGIPSPLYEQGAEALLPRQ